MTAASTLSLASLALGVGVATLGAVGVSRARDVYGRLHFGGPSNFLAPLALAAACALGLGASSATTVRALLIVPLLAIGGPVVGHATARAARLKARETLDVRPDDAGAAR